MVELAVLGAEGVEDCTGCRDDRGVGVGMALVTMVTTAHNDGPTPLTGLTSRTAETTAQDAMQALRYMYICDAGIEVHTCVHMHAERTYLRLVQRGGGRGQRSQMCVLQRGWGHVSLSGLLRHRRGGWRESSRQQSCSMWRGAMAGHGAR